MLHLSRFEPAPSTFSAFIACLWQGDVPASLELRTYLYTSTEPLSMVLLWEGAAEATAYMERAFGGFGAFETELVTDWTPGMRAAFDRDLDGLGTWMRGRGVDDLPGRSTRLRRPEGGHRATIVGGVVTQRDGELTGARPGTMLERQPRRSGRPIGRHDGTPRRGGNRHP